MSKHEFMNQKLYTQLYTHKATHILRDLTIVLESPLKTSIGLLLIDHYHHPSGCAIDRFSTLAKGLN
jgi:hypothetical protein